MSGTSLTPKPVVVFDKSFAQGTSYKTLQEVAQSHIVVVTSSFYFETFSTLSQSRKSVFAGFPDFCRIHVPNIFKREKELGAPVLSIDVVNLRVNPDVISGSRDLTTVENQCITNFESQFVRPQIAFWKDVIQNGVVGFSNPEIKSVIGDFLAFKQLCNRILNVDFIRSAAVQMDFPFAGILDARWFTFRWIQARLSHGLTLLYQYPNPNQTRGETDLEHDVHDVDYLTLGLHAGNFACNESRDDFRKLGWKFKFISPEGCLLQSESKNGVSHLIAR